MIQTSIEPDSLAGAADVLALSLLLLSLPPQAASATLTAASTASNTFGVFTLPPRGRPPPTRRPLSLKPFVTRLPGAQRRPELRHEPIPITAIDRTDELHHLPSLTRAGPFEQEGRRVQRHAQDLGLLLVRDGRL